MNRLFYTISALAIGVSAPAHSETLAADLWAEWQAQAAITGQTVNATIVETDTGLTLTNFTTVFADEGITTRGAIDEIQLTENPDGTVSVTFSELYSITVTFAMDDGDPPGNIELQLRHEGLDVRVSGDPGDRTYTYTADSLTLTEGAIWGGDGPPPTIDLDLVMTGLSSTYTITGTEAETMRFVSSASLGSLQMVLELAPPPPEEGQFKAGLLIGPMQSTSSGSVLSLAALNQFAGEIPPGLELEGTVSYGPAGLEMMFEESDDWFQATYTNQGGNAAFGFSDTEVSYDIAASGMDMTMAGAEIPVPVSLGVGSSEISLAIPLAASDELQDVSLRAAYQDVTMGDSLWALVDPGQAIPRDPASMILDVTGQVRLFLDLLTIDPEELTGPPGEVRALSVSELEVSVGGAALTGSADVTFAPGQIMPVPVGSADLQLSGGNALLDALMAGGMVPAQEGAMVRGMANIFARPGAAPDTLETTIEFSEDGSVTANGIPLQ